MSTHNNSGSGDRTDTTKKAWNNMEGTPDTKPANGDGTQPNARSGDPKKV